MYCCSLHETIFVPSRLTPNADIHMFKAGVEPKWEDPECAHGGKWTFVVTNNRKQALDKAWLETVIPSSLLLFLSLDHCGLCPNVCFFSLSRNWAAVDGFDWRAIR